MIETKFQRIEEEYQALRNAQDSILYHMDRTLPAIFNAIEKNSQAIALLDDKLNALMQHFDVDYKPPMGFAPESDE